MRDNKQAGWFGRPRSYWRERMESERFDLIIIGGGITGAGIAREASLAGLRVALLEAHDFASGTSSRSTKLIHGGLRYLAQGHVRLVREAGSERAVLRRLAPHLVEPIPFLLPIYKGMQHGKLAMSTAIWMYDRLAGVEKAERRRNLSTTALRGRHAALSPDGLRGGVLYHEYVTDDARLTLSTLQSATEWGTVVLNDCPVQALVMENGQVCGVRAHDNTTGRDLLVRGDVIVNAAGPWIENVLALGDATRSDIPARVTHSRGIHLSFSSERLPLPHALAVQTPDGRLVFVIPKRDVTYLGTTDKRYDGDLRHPAVPEDEVQYLLDIANRLLPEAGLKQDDIIGIWSGVRPLVEAKGSSAADTKDVSREDEIWVSPQGLITIAGGKLTAYRKMAERILAKVRERHPEGHWQQQQDLSPVLPLYGAKEIPHRSCDAWLEREASRLQAKHGLAQEDALALLRRYGDRTEDVLTGPHAARLHKPTARLVPDIPLFEAEIPYMAQHEMALHAVDVLARRTELGRFQGLKLTALIDIVASRLQTLLGWSDEQRQREIEVCRRECRIM